jgi:hypothetical protein
MTAYKNSDWNIALRPDSAAYGIVIESMSMDRYNNADKSNVAEQAEKLLDEMETQAAAGFAEVPNVRVYTAVMKAHYKSGDPDAPLKVENLLRRMKASYETGNVYAKPDGHTMTLLLQTWGKSNVPNRAAIAWSIHKQMQEAYDRGDLAMRPNPYSLGAILTACATIKSNEKLVQDETVKIALMALNELDKVTDGSLSDFAFRLVFQVITNHIDDKAERLLHARVILQRCCEAGFVNEWIIDTLKKHVPSLYYQLPKGSDQTLNLPQSWSRNVRHRDGKRPHTVH